MLSSYSVLLTNDIIVHVEYLAFALVSVHWCLSYNRLGGSENHS